MVRPATHPARKPSQSRPATVPCTFICTACGTVEHTPTPALPEGWSTEAAGNDIYVYCPDDGIDASNGSAVQ